MNGKLNDKNYDSYVLLSKAEFPTDITSSSPDLTIDLPGIFVDLEFVAYLEFPLNQQYFNYNEKFVNGIENAKLHLFIKDLPSFIEIEENEATGCDSLRLLNYDKLPRNLNILLKVMSID